MTRIDGTQEPIRAELIGFAKSLSGFGKDLNAGVASISGDDRTIALHRVWNVGFIRAATDLLDSIVLLVEAEQYLASYALLRTLLELAANQYYMAQEPGRALTFAAEELSSKMRLLETAEDLSFGTTEQREEIARLLAEDRAAFEAEEPEVVVRLDEKSFYPFGKAPWNRFHEAGPRWLSGHYRTVYAMASDVVHMNARAIGLYLSEPEPLGARGKAQVGMAAEFYLRVLYKADQILGLKRADWLDGYGRELARIMYPDREAAAMLAYFRP